jgi:NAD+ synthase (glutamine-hydrolysing)
MKIALAQLNYHIGNFESNTAKIIDHIQKAQQNGADLVVFAELCVSGYPARDFLEFDEFIDLCDESAKKIAAVCTNIACIIGLPTYNHKEEGKDLNNSAYFIENGQIKAVVNKALLPNYDVFDEYRSLRLPRFYCWCLIKCNQTYCTWPSAIWRDCVIVYFLRLC